MKLSTKAVLLLAFFVTLTSTGYANKLFGDTTRAYAVPTLIKTPKGQVAVSWTEKDNAGVVYFYWAESADKGRTFGDKKLIFSSPGLGSSRLMRPKLLFKKDGTVVAVFSLRGPETAVAQTNQPNAHASHEAASSGHDHGTAASHSDNKPRTDSPSKGGPRAGGRPTDLQIVYCYSGDNGNTWSVPTPVHSDKSPNIVRGFFDATILANGEIGVAYLNDIAGKAHQRDLRFVTSTGNRFGTEKILDPFVCDCCNISLLVDAGGTLQVYYRENQDNIRDIATMSSGDNGLTFTKPAILSKDNWQINGCPHSGPTSSASATGTVIAWFSGTTDAPGIRLVNQQGKRLFVLDDPSARNAYLVPAPKTSVLLWEQSQPSETGTASVIAFRTVGSDQTSATQFVKNGLNATNASGIVMGNQLVVAYEVRTTNNKNSVSFAQVDLP